jgi:hypothetical protein
LPVAVWAPLPENGPATYWPIAAAGRLRTLANADVSVAVASAQPAPPLSRPRLCAAAGPAPATGLAARPGERTTAGRLLYEGGREPQFAQVAAAIARLCDNPASKPPGKE